MKRASFVKRFVALVLAAAIVLPNVNWSASRVSAAEGEKTITASELVAKNYEELSDAEKDLLNSGMLVGETFVYTVPSNDDDLVVIDPTAKQVIVDEFEKWVPVSATIKAEGTSEELSGPVVGEEGYVFDYQYAGNAFSVEVTYSYDVEVAAEIQNLLLNAADDLNRGLAEMKAAYNATDANLGTVVLAMPELGRLADGIDYGILTLKLGSEAAVAVNNLRAELAENDGELKLQKLNAAYATSTSKVQFLKENGAEYKAVIEETYANLKAIADDYQIMKNTLFDQFFEQEDPVTYTRWMSFKGILGTTVNGMEPVADAEAWNAEAVKADADFAALETLVAAIDASTEVEVKNVLNVDTAVVKQNASMYDVTINVVLYTVVKENDSTALTDGEVVSKTITLEEGATPEEIVAAVEASNVETVAKLSWSGFNEDGYNRTATDLVHNLTSDIIYTIEYNPKEIAVTYGYQTDAPTTVPYGYRMTLPKHTDAKQAYDYKVNGETMAQGEVYVVTAPTEITREAGKAYTSYKMYSVVADCFGDAATKAILKSGALFGDKTINIRKPEATDAADLLLLKDGKLEGKEYKSNFETYNWAPYTYGIEGTENEFDGLTADWTEESAKVQYILNLNGVIDAQAVLDLAVTLEEEAAAQVSALGRLLGHKGTMGELNKTKLGALNGVIGVTDLNSNAAKNEELKAYFSEIVGNIINNNVAANGNLKIYNMLQQYENNGLRYFYENSAAVIAEIDSLSANLTGMMADEEKKEALRILCDAAGYPQYVESISNMEQILAEVKRDLIAPNEAIDLDSENLGVLLTALTDDVVAQAATAEAPYLVSDTLTVKDSSKTMISVKVDVDGKTTTIASALYNKTDVIDQTVIDDLKAQIEAFASNELQENIAYYECDVEGSLDDLVGKALAEDAFVTYTYAAKEYTVKIEGEADQTITFKNLEVKLPAHIDANFEYQYEIADVAGITTTTYTFTTAHLDSLFVDGVYTIKRVEINLAKNAFEANINELNRNSENEYVITTDEEDNITLTATVTDVMSFATDMVDVGYSYISLNGEPLLGLNADTLATEIYLQTLINAMLRDEEFSNLKLIELGKNNGGVVLTADMYLGNEEPVRTMAMTEVEADYSVVTKFVLNLKTMPEEMLTLSNALEAVKQYVSFESNEMTGKLDVDLTLPQKAYEAYVAAMLLTGNVDKTDVNTLNNKVVYEFFREYVDVITNSDATTTTFQNTWNKLDNAVNDKIDKDLPDYVLTNYEKYYQKVKEALNEGVNPEIIATEDNCEVKASASGDNIKKLATLLGFDLGEYATFIAEIKNNDYITVNANVELTNTAKNYEAAILDVRNDELLSKAEMVEDLPARLKEVEGAAVIVLLDKVEGDLTFNATTVMDLNGQTIEGNITSNKNLIIVDSSLNNDNAGGVTGTISGTATIIGGYYKDASVEAFVKDGYELKQTANGYQVQNVLYTLSTGANGDLAFDINSDILEENIDRYTVFAAELAADVAVDLVANYYTAAALSVEVLNDRNQDDNFAPGWKKIYDFSFTDFVDLVESDSIPTDLLNMGLKMVSLPDLACVINMITADLLDLNAIQSALKNNQAIASYGFQIAPWMIEIEHKTEEDYLTFGLTTNEDNAKSIHISLFISGENYTDEMAEVIAYIDRIVVEEDTFFQLVDVEELTYADKHFNLTGGAKGKVHLDLSDYTTAMAILVANGLSDDAEADVDKIVAAVNNGDKDALKVEFDKLTVKDVFDAAKVLNRNNSLAELAEKVGITVKVEPNKYLEKALVLSLSAAGKVLERFDITGNDATLGNLDDDGDGIYEFGPKSVSKSGTITKRGYGVNLDLTIAEGAIAINLFNDDCLWGDADHNGEVNAKDASLILAYAVEDITGTFNMDEVNKTNICLKKTDVNGDGKTNAKDASLVLAYVVEDISKFPVEE